MCIRDREEFDTQAAGTMYAVSREEWEESPEFDARVQDLSLIHI